MTQDSFMFLFYSIIIIIVGLLLLFLNIPEIALILLKKNTK
jgi:hypothetical protein